MTAPVEMIAMADGYSAYKNAASPMGIDYLKSGRILAESEVISRGQRLESDFLNDSVRPAEARRRHQGRLNVIFCDGHVEALSIETFFYRKTDFEVRRWNADNEPHQEMWSLLP